MSGRRGIALDGNLPVRQPEPDKPVPRIEDDALVYMDPDTGIVRRVSDGEEVHLSTTELVQFGFLPPPMPQPFSAVSGLAGAAGTLASGFETLNQALADMGAAGEAMWQSLGHRSSNEELQRALDSINESLDGFDDLERSWLARTWRRLKRWVSQYRKEARRQELMSHGD